MAKICCKCGGILSFVDTCPSCNIPLRNIEKAVLFKDHICNTCGPGFETYEDIIGHYCDRGEEEVEEEG